MVCPNTFIPLQEEDHYIFLKLKGKTLNRFDFFNTVYSGAVMNGPLILKLLLYAVKCIVQTWVAWTLNLTVCLCSKPLFYLNEVLISQKQHTNHSLFSLAQFRLTVTDSVYLCISAGNGPHDKDAVWWKLQSRGYKGVFKCCGKTDGVHACHHSGRRPAAPSSVPCWGLCTSDTGWPLYNLVNKMSLLSSQHTDQMFVHLKYVARRNPQTRPVSGNLKLRVCFVAV